MKKEHVLIRAQALSSVLVPQISFHVFFFQGKKKKCMSPGNFNSELSVAFGTK